MVLICTLNKLFLKDEKIYFLLLKKTVNGDFISLRNLQSILNMLNQWLTLLGWSDPSLNNVVKTVQFSGEVMEM